MAFGLVAARRPLTFALLFLFSACGGAAQIDDDAGPDATRADTSRPDGPPARCTRDFECSDGVFCNGAERCDPSARDADARGCAPPDRPACLEGQACSESLRRCESECDRAGDADGDGHRALNCPGGDDCDDADAQRYPGRTEVCDEHDRDEDCDPRTYGPRDVDGDRHNDRSCCNTDAAGARTCGDDCDDRRATVNPDNPEVCDGFDNNCDGRVDDGVTRTFYVDADGDGYGSRATGAMTRAGCALPAGYAETNTDCDDGARAVHPGVHEVCNGVDDDCDGAPDNDVPGIGETCGTGVPGVCNAGVRRCRGATGAACVPLATSSAEVCDGLDNDCDGMTDEADPGGGASCATGRPGACAAGVLHCQSGALRCVADLAAIAEICDGVDNDCDGAIDNGVPTVGCYRDADGDGFPAPAAVPPLTRCGGCPAGYTTRVPAAGLADCADGNSAAYPGQTLYFSTQRDASGSYDYDCSGTTEMYGPTTAGTLCPAVGCTSTSFWVGSVPACGETGTIRRCTATATLLCLDSLDEPTQRGCR